MSLKDSSTTRTTTLSSLYPWQHAVSGAVAGLISRIIIAPLDVIKIRLQIQPEKKLSLLKYDSNAKYSGLWNTFKRIIEEEGIAGLWKGNISAQYLYLSYGAIQFYSYSQINAFFSQEKFKHWSSEKRAFVSGASAGSLATFFTYPFDLLRTRFAAQGNEKIYKGILDAVHQIHQSEGFYGFYRGLWPAIVQIIPYMGIMFGSQKFLKEKLMVMDEFIHRPGRSDFIAGAGAGAISKTIVMPLDVVRKRYQVQGPSRNSYIIHSIPNYHDQSVFATTRNIVKHEGFFGLYKGLLPSVLKTVPMSAITFLVVGWCQTVFLKFNR